jgi:hypothetical protein
MPIIQCIQLNLPCDDDDEIHHVPNVSQVRSAVQGETKS